MVTEHRVKEMQEREAQRIESKTKEQEKSKSKA